MSEKNTIQASTGAIKKRFKKGRGIPSGSGKTCGRGHRGQKCRSGYSKQPWREGGQTPLYRRLPKRQTNIRVNRKVYTTLNLDELQLLADAGIKEIDAITIVENGILKTVEKYGIKILAKGELRSAVSVKADKFSEAARQAIEKAGGKALEAVLD
jgi:large subunit ribosomal protein L15